MQIPSPLKMLCLAPLFSAAVICSGCEEKSGVKIGTVPPVINATELAGRPVNLEAFKGKVVLIYFWTNSCCGDRLKEMEKLYRRYRGRGLEILAINVMDSRQEVAGFCEMNRISFPMVTDSDSRHFNAYRVRAFPTIYVLDREGVVCEKVLGSMRSSRLEKLIQSVIDGGKI